jgi:hypothetical protein
VANAYTNNFGGNTIAASNAVTYTNYATAFLNTPVAGTNVTITNPYSLISAGAVLVNSTASATSTTTGALVVTGGVGVGGRLYATELYDNGARVLTSASASASTSTLQQVTNVGFTTTNRINITNTTSATSTTTGALTVSGGVGVGGNIFAGGTITAGAGASYPVTISSNATNLSGYISASLQSLQYEAKDHRWYVSGFSKLFLNSNTLTVQQTTVSTSTNTGALVVAGGAGIAGNLYVGNRMGFVNTSNVSVVYQVYNPVTNSLDTVFG